eukprot:gene2133-1308_t
MAFAFRSSFASLATIATKEKKKPRTQYIYIYIYIYFYIYNCCILPLYRALCRHYLEGEDLVKVVEKQTNQTDLGGGGAQHCAASEISTGDPLDHFYQEVGGRSLKKSAGNRLNGLVPFADKLNFDLLLLLLFNNSWNVDQIIPCAFALFLSLSRRIERHSHGLSSHSHCRYHNIYSLYPSKGKKKTEIYSLTRLRLIFLFAFSPAPLFASQLNNWDRTPNSRLGGALHRNKRSAETKTNKQTNKRNNLQGSHTHTSTASNEVLTPVEADSTETLLYYQPTTRRRAAEETDRRRKQEREREIEFPIDLNSECCFERQQQQQQQSIVTLWRITPAKQFYRSSSEMTLTANPLENNYPLPPPRQHLASCSSAPPCRRHRQAQRITTSTINAVVITSSRRSNRYCQLNKAAQDRELGTGPNPLLADDGGCTTAELPRERGTDSAWNLLGLCCNWCDVYWFDAS